MDRLSDLGHLSSRDWERLQDLLDRFEKAWQTRTNPKDSVDLRDYLPRPKDALRPLALHELIKTDLEFRWRRGQTIGLEFYLDAFPELGPARGLPAKLIGEEYRVRQHFGDKLPLSIYQRRFPDQFPELQKLVEFQAGATRTPPPGSNPEPPLQAPPAVAPMAYREGMEVGHGYSLLRRIGDGGFGEVWRARSQGGIEVAIKIGFRTLDNEESQRELQSLELVKQLRHPFLLQTHDFWTNQGRLHIAMELADGNLRDRLKQCRQQGQSGIPVAELARYFRQVAEALDFLHARHVLHRDIKPDNILLQSGFAKVADFGLARQLSQHSLSVSGSGTPAYMAPEMFGSKVNAHTDQYCLAVTYAELRLDRRLFPGKDLMELMMQHVTLTPNLDPLDKPEREALLRALDKKPDQRYGSCVEFVEALEQALVAEGVPGVKRSSVVEVALPAGGPARTPPSKTPPNHPATLAGLHATLPGTAVTAPKEPGSDTPATLSSDTQGRPPSPPPWATSSRADAPPSQPWVAQTKIPTPKPETRARSWKVETADAGGRRLSKKWLVATVLAVAVVGAGVALWMAKKGLDQEVRPLVDEHRYEEALGRIDAAGPLSLPFKAGWRGEVLAGWREWAATLQKPADVEREALFILKRFPDDASGKELLNKALAGQVKEFTDKDRFRDALDLVRKKGRGLAGTAKELEQGILQCWLNRTEKKLKSGHKTEAETMGTEIKDAFNNDSKVVTRVDGLFPRAGVGSDRAVMANRDKTKRVDALLERAKKALAGKDFRASSDALDEAQKVIADRQTPGVVAPDTSNRFHALRNQVDAYLKKVSEAKQRYRVTNLLDQAAKAYDDNQPLENCLRPLKDAEKYPLDHEADRKLRVLRCLAWSRYGDPGQRAEAAREFEKLLPDLRYRRVQVCENFADLARKQVDDCLPRALKALGEVLRPGRGGKELSPQERDPIARQYRDLIETTVPRLDKTHQWKKLQEDAFPVPPPDAWALACKAECILEKSSRNPSEGELKDARDAALDPKTSEAGPYAHYVRALVYHAMKDHTADTATELQRLFSGDSRILGSALRRDRVIDASLEVVAEFRSRGTPLRPFESEAKAALAYDLLIKARSLAEKAGRNFDTEAVVNLALAAWTKKDPDRRLGGELTDRLVKSPGLADLKAAAFPLLLGRANALQADRGGRGAALDSYEEILRLFLEKKSLPLDDGTVPGRARALYDAVVVPALRLAEDAPADKAARLNGYRGLLLRDHHQDFPKDFRPLDKALDAFGAAIRLHPRAEYYVKRAFARRTKAKAEGVPVWKVLRRIEEDVNAALDRADKEHYPLAYSQHAWVLETKGGWAQGPERVRLFKQALDAYGKALDLLKGREEEKDESPTILMNRAQVLIDLAHGENDHAKRTTHLDQAQKEAERATEYDRHRYIDLIWGKLGSIYEDRAWMLGDKKFYPLAITAFNTASEKKDLPAYRLAKGRCYFRRAKFGDPDPKRNDLARATEELNAVFRLDPKDLQPAQAHYWLGSVSALQQDYAGADAQFEKAYRLARAGGPPAKDFLDRVLVDWTEATLDGAAAAFRRGNRDKGAALVKAVRARAREIRAAFPTHAARFLGRCLELEDRPRDALDEYTDALDSKVPDILLYLARIDLLVNGRFRTRLQAIKMKDYSMKAMSDRAYGFTKDSSLFDPWVKASCFASAALARLDAATTAEEEDDKRQYRKEAGLWLRKAIQLAPRHPRRAEWEKALNKTPAGKK